MISTAFIWGTSIACVLMAASLVVIVWAFFDDSELSGPNAISGVLVLLVTLGTALWGWHPYDMRYHRYVHVEGIVREVGVQMLDGDQVHAIKIGDVTYECDDARCSLVKSGQRLSLWCIREYRANATHGWRCNYEG